MKKIIVTIITTLSIYFSLAQSASEMAMPTFERAIYYSNRFGWTKNDKPDSALYYIRMLATLNEGADMLKSRIHDGLAQSFMKGREKYLSEIKNAAERRKIAVMMRKGIISSAYILKAMMVDTNKALQAAVEPINYWVEVQKNNKNDNKLKLLVNEFMEKQLSRTDLYDNCILRYGLLIHQEIALKKSLADVAQNLLQQVYIKLEKGQVYEDVTRAGSFILEKRAWYRYLYAYANNIMAKDELRLKNIKTAGTYFAISAKYSPDNIDNTVDYAFFYEAAILMGNPEKITFQDDYLNYLTKYETNKNISLGILLDKTLTNPAYKKDLKAYYNTYFKSGEKFEDYWINANAKKLTNVSSFSLTKTNGEVFILDSTNTKWVLLDFWGTWCEPCREEHPDVEKFYKDIAPVYKNKLTVLTIACKDNIEKVGAYMKKFNYSFPVAMADEMIEMMFNVSSYPTKILISPQGKYIVVPNREDWVKYIKNYADL